MPKRALFLNDMCSHGDLSIWPTIGQILMLAESVIRSRLRQLNLSRFDVFAWVATKDF